MRYPRNAAGNRRRSGEARRRFRRGMNPTTLLLLYAFGAVVALIVLIARYKLHPFIALIAVSLALGLRRECLSPASSRRSRMASVAWWDSSQLWSPSAPCSAT